MKRIAWLLLIATVVAATASSGWRAEPPGAPPQPAATTFSADELRAFTALEPIDTHTHVFQSDPAFYALLQRLHLHIVDICVVDRHSKFQAHLEPQLDAAMGVVHSSGGQASLCTTFDPYPFSEPGFAAAVIRQINRDFEQGAIALKIWKNIGMELQDAKGNYVLPDNPVFSPIYKDIAAHHKTLIAHVADPNTLWEPPNPDAPDYSYYMEHPEWYMYKKPHPASKEAILRARDHLLEQNPDLRVVGAHLGSMEADFDELGRHLDHYSNFAVDLAARMPYLMKAPRAKMVAFITKYQDRLIYATDLGFEPGQDVGKVVKEWEETYARDWRFFATGESVDERGHKVEGLSLPEPLLRKLYHDNAVRWFPGIVAAARLSLTGRWRILLDRNCTFRYSCRMGAARNMCCAFATPMVTVGASLAKSSFPARRESSGEPPLKLDGMKGHDVQSRNVSDFKELDLFILPVNKLQAPQPPRAASHRATIPVGASKPFKAQHDVVENRTLRSSNSSSNWKIKR